MLKIELNSLCMYQSVSFSPMHFTLCKLNQLSDSAIFPKLTISLLSFCVTFEFFTSMLHWVLGTAKIQFFPLKLCILISKLLSKNLEVMFYAGNFPISSKGMYTLYMNLFTSRIFSSRGRSIWWLIRIGFIFRPTSLSVLCPLGK